MPKFIQFEINTVCQASCSFCPRGKMTLRPTLKWSQINHIIEKTIPTASACCPFLYGEPALEPRLPNILGYIKQVNPLIQTTIYSNMGGWKPEAVERIIREGNLDELVTSLYAPTKMLHEKYQRGVGYDEAWRNLKTWHDARERLKLGKPKITWHYIAIPELMEHVQDYAKRVSQFTDGGGVVHYDTFHGLVPDMGDNSKYFGEPHKVRAPCSRLWSGMTILSNGDVAPCCQDFDDSTPLGNVFKEEPRNIWRGELFEKLREMHVQGRQSEIPLCRECIYWRHMEGREWVKLWENDK